MRGLHSNSPGLYSSTPLGIPGLIGGFDDSGLPTDVVVDTGGVRKMVDVMNFERIFDVRLGARIDVVKVPGRSSVWIG
jgi:hypothetical protein